MANLRCRPGDLARIIYSKNPCLVGRTVIVEHMSHRSAGCWEVTILGEPAFGITFYSKRPIVTNQFVFRDTSLIPLRGEGFEHVRDKQEVSHE